MDSDDIKQWLLQKFTKKHEENIKKLYGEFSYMYRIRSIFGGGGGEVLKVLKHPPPGPVHKYGQLGTLLSYFIY